MTPTGLHSRAASSSKVEAIQDGLVGGVDQPPVNAVRSSTLRGFVVDHDRCWPTRIQATDVRVPELNAGAELTPNEYRSAYQPRAHPALGRRRTSRSAAALLGQALSRLDVVERGEARRHLGEVPQPRRALDEIPLEPPHRGSLELRRPALGVEPDELQRLFEREVG
jgi:hypothetical protein